MNIPDFSSKGENRYIKNNPYFNNKLQKSLRILEEYRKLNPSYFMELDDKFENIIAIPYPEEYLNAKK